MDFSPLKVIHGIKYSCWKPQVIGKIERNKILVFMKVCLPEFLLSGKLQKFVYAKLKNFCKFLASQNFLLYYSTNFKTGKSEFNFFWEISMCITYVKTFAVVPDHICSFCNGWTLLTFSQKSVSRMLMYQLVNNLKYLIGCWISQDFTWKNVLTWFVLVNSRCRVSFLFPFQQIFYKDVNIDKY